MKKMPRKLGLRGQTLRVLDNTDLVGAVGGLETSAPRIYDSGAAVCPTWPTAAVATAAGG